VHQLQLVTAATAMLRSTRITLLSLLLITANVDYEFVNAFLSFPTPQWNGIYTKKMTNQRIRQDSLNDHMLMENYMVEKKQYDLIEDTMSYTTNEKNNRRHFLTTLTTSFLMNEWFISKQQPMSAFAVGDLPDTFNVDDYIKTGMVMNPMGVSGQAGKSKPITGM
jgi:hypothetical protein